MKPSPWDQRYNSQSYLFGTEPSDFISENLGLLRPKEALCLGEGEGRNAVFLARQGFSVTAVDASAIGLKKCQQLAHKNNVSLTTMHCDIAEYQFKKNRWDTITSVFLHLPRNLRASMHRRLYEALRAEGTYVLIGYTPRQHLFNTGGPSDPELLFQIKEIIAELDRFELLKVVQTDLNLQEGKAHNGMSSVLQIIAQKKS